MEFEAALKSGKLDEARALLDELVQESGSDRIDLAECWADLAGAFDRRREHDSAITALLRAIELGWHTIPDARSDIAEFHLRAGRGEEAARIWAELKADDPDDVWLYNAAGLSYNEVGEHELAAEWLAEGIELAIRDGDPEGIVAQLSGVRRRSLEALGRVPDELELRAGEFVAQWRERDDRPPSFAEVSELADRWLTSPEVDEELQDRGGTVAVAVSWFPAGEYEKAIDRWESLAEDWAGVPHADYCRRLDGNIKWMRAHGVQVSAVSPIDVDGFVAWCSEHGKDPEEARAGYAAELLRLGEAIAWPPGRNETCWCGSGRKYKKCCATAPAAPMHPAG